MGLKNILLRLLPRLVPSDSREHVLGDLEETGFRWRDCLTAVAAAGTAALRREFTGPIPRLVNAPEDAMRRRIAQLSGPNFIFGFWWIAAMAGNMHLFFGMTGIAALLPGLLLALVACIFRRPRTASSLPLSVVYRRRLIARLVSLIPLCGWVVALRFDFSPDVIWWALAFTAIFTLYRGWRLATEFHAARHLWEGHPMNRLLSSLLPRRDIREHILGILHREFIGPIPRLVNASDDAIRQRIIQLSGPNLLWSAVYFGACFGACLGVIGYEMAKWPRETWLGWVTAALLCLAISLSLGLVGLSPDRPLLDLYRFRLTARFFYQFSFFVVLANAVRVVLFSRKVLGGVVLFTMIFVGYRGGRLLMELKASLRRPAQS